MNETLKNNTPKNNILRLNVKKVHKHMQLHLFIITFRHEQLQSTTYRATRINRGS